MILTPAGLGISSQVLLSFKVFNSFDFNLNQ